ncbi:MAG: transcriptional repressor [Planctomycetota bacterium]
MTPQKRFEEYLQAKGQRQTPQRKLLIDEIFRQHSHFDADQLIERLPRKGQPGYVSKATVYRALREFVDASLLNCFELDGRTVYELEYGYPNHDHLYCTRCQKLVEFRDEAMIALREKTAAEHGFRVTRHRLLIHGVCRDCLKSRRTRRKQDLV